MTDAAPQTCRKLSEETPPIKISCCCMDPRDHRPSWNRKKCMLLVSGATWWPRAQPGRVWIMTEWWRAHGVEGSDAEGHVTEQPLLRAAVIAVSEGGDRLVLLRRHVQTLVAVHMQKCESLEEKQTRYKTGANSNRRAQHKGWRTPAEDPHQVIRLLFANFQF